MVAYMLERWDNRPISGGKYINLLLENPLEYQKSVGMRSGRQVASGKWQKVDRQHECVQVCHAYQLPERRW